MGQAPPSRCRILVVGLPGAGKTHLLNMLESGAGTTALPTNGFNEIVYDNYELVEYGGRNNWKLMLEREEREFSGIILVIGGANDQNDVALEANSALLYVCELLPRVPCVYVWNDVEPIELKMIPRDRSVAVCALKFQEETWIKNVEHMLEWIRASGASRASAKKRPK